MLLAEDGSETQQEKVLPLARVQGCRCVTLADRGGVGGRGGERAPDGGGRHPARVCRGARGSTGTGLKWTGGRFAQRR